MKISYVGLVLIVIGASIEVFADTLFKLWNDKGGNHLIIVSIVLYLIGTCCWVSSLKYETFTRSGVIFLLLSVIMLSLTGLFFFKDELSTINKVGIVLGIVSIIMVEM
jgi:drug/metabolite transporter (DMT)-like permease